MSGPVVPPGTNPYTAYLAALETLFYPAQTPGFKIRMIVLFVVLGLALAMACVHLGLSIWDGHRRKANVFWLFRFVQRTSGGYLVTNTKLVSTVFSIINLTTFLCYTYNVYDIFLFHAPMSTSFSWRAFPPVGLIVQGWMLSWGLLQAYLLTQEKFNSRGFGAKTVNITFVAGGFVLIAGVVASAIVMALAGNMLWSDGVKLFDALKKLEPTYDGTTSDLLQLSPALAKLNKAATHYNKTNVVEFGLVGSVATLIALVNMGALALTRLLRRQIKMKKDQIGMRSRALNLVESGIGLSAQPVPRLSIRAIARGSNGADGETAKQLVVLQKAERDLLYTSSALVFVATAAAGFCFNVVYQSGQKDYFQNWSILELTATAIQWLYGVVLLVAFTLLNWNTIRSFPSKQGATTAESVTATGSPTVMSFGDFFAGPESRRTTPFLTTRPTFTPLESGLSTPEAKEKLESDRESEGGYGVAL